MCSCLGRPSHERIVSRLGMPNLEYCIVKTWGHGIAIMWHFKLGVPSLEQTVVVKLNVFFFLIIVICFHFLEDQIMKNIHYLCQTVSRLRKPSLEECWHEIAKTCQKCGYQVLTICFTSVHVFKDQVMEDIILLGSNVENTYYPKSFKTWKAKSWIMQSLSWLCGMELQNI